MKSIENEIFNELERLLRNAGPEDFLRAYKRKSTSKYMKSALESLALESLGRTRNLKNSNTTESYRQTPQKSLLDKREATLRSGRTGTKTEAEEIYELLMNSKRFANKSTMMNFAKHLGLRVVVNNKDNKIRTAKKLAKVIAYGSGQIRKDFLSMLNEKLDDQTKGWFDIIRSR